jgi:O-antigen/teichoic acid export membrane protein
LALAEMPEALAGNVIRHVVYPAISRARNEAPAQFAATYYRLRGWIDPLVHITLGGLVALSDWVIRLLYPDTYGGASAILKVLALRSSVHLVSQMCEQCFFACGESQYGFRRNMTVSVSTFICLPIGAYFAGMEGVLWGSVIARGMPLFVLWPAARERGFLWLSRELLVLVYLAAGYAIGLGAEQILPAWRLR